MFILFFPGRIKPNLALFFFPLYSVKLNPHDFPIYYYLYTVPNDNIVMKYVFISDVRFINILPFLTFQSFSKAFFCRYVEV